MDKTEGAAELRAKFMAELGRMKGLKKDPQSIVDELARWIALIDHWRVRPFCFATPPRPRDLAEMTKETVLTAEKAIDLLSQVYEHALTETARWDDDGRMIDGDEARQKLHRMCESLNFIRRELDVIEAAQKRFENRALAGANHSPKPGPLVAREIALRLSAAGVHYERTGQRVYNAAARWVWSLLDLDTKPEGAMRDTCRRRTETPSPGDIWDGVPFRFKEEPARTLEGVWMQTLRKDPRNTD